MCSSIRYSAIVLIAMFAAGARELPASENPKDYTTHVVGYAHIDMAWLWRWEESVHDIMFHTFSNQLNLMKAYPEFTFAQDQAVVYEMMEHYYPDIYKEIVQRAKTGNWIPLSSTWTQMDENMPDGESLVRQFLLGQKATKERFGHYVRVAWQPDVFGHPYSLPQIARKAGVEFIVFNRPQDTNRPPIIWWQGLDGTRVLGYSTPGEYVGTLDHHRTTELSMAAARRMNVKNILLLYGTGDHGGGPNSNDVAMIPRLNASPADVHVKTTNVEGYFDLLLAERQDIPVVNSELNGVFEGCYTTQADMKRHNRKAEQLLLTAEKMSSLAVINKYRDYYPTRDLGEAWKLAALNQTHDLLPGSGIGPIYEDAARQYQEIFERGRRALDFSLKTIGLHVDTRGQGVPLVIYNPHSWDRTDIVAAEISAPSLPSDMVAAHGDDVVPVQVLRRQNHASRTTATIVFVARAVPQMGLKLYRILPAAHRAPPPASGLHWGTQPRPYLENEFLRVEINPKTGNIGRLFDKKANREVLRGEGNFLVALSESGIQARKLAPDWAGTAWDVGLTGERSDMDGAASVEWIEQGPARATIRVLQHFRQSEFTRNISLAADVPRVDVEMSMDWHERNIFLKVGFPLAAATRAVAAEIPYGVIERAPTGREMVMGKWVDASGLAILNNGRHGFDASEGVVRISAIRGPTMPDPRSDEGLHSFGYALYPHRGNWREGKVEFRAMEFNAPLVALQEPIHSGSDDQLQEGPGIPGAYSFVTVAGDHVILSAMKQMEGFYDTDSILRFFECEGREGEVTVQFPFKIRASETNLLEDDIGPAMEGHSVRLSLKPWEIKSLRVRRLEEGGSQ